MPVKSLIFIDMKIKKENKTSKKKKKKNEICPNQTAMKYSYKQQLQLHSLRQSSLIFIGIQK